MHAWSLPSRPCAHATASLSALTSAPSARALIRILCASTSARGGHALGRAGPGRESTAACLLGGITDSRGWLVLIPKS
eukprot:7755178-Pyramimonas_sp.AAC.1